MNSPAPITTPVQRRWFAILAGLLIIAGIALLAVLPWAYPSSSLLYKFGIDRVLLLSGKSAGIAIALLLVIQMVLVARFRWIERRIAQNRLITLHRYLGTAIVVMALLHPLLVFAPEEVSTIPVSMEYWPEIVGAVLLVAFIAAAVFTVGRDFMGLPHHVWKLLHRLTALVLMAGLVVHALFVNDGYGAGLPRYVLLACAALFALLWLLIMIRPKFRKNPHQVVAVTPEGAHSVALRMKPLNSTPLPHLPGQFAYLRINSTALPAEEHPFTIASAPDEADGLGVTVRCSGDWTRKLGRVRVGDVVHVDGPYGQFSPLAFPAWRQLILIAGGVGVTPMLSALRHFDRSGDDREITLVWYNRTRHHIVHEEELAAIMARRPNYTTHFVFSRDSGTGGNDTPTGIDRLRQNIGPYEQGKLVLVCGPEGFMKQRKADLKALGYPGKVIKTEMFRM